eukprot:32167-Pyramimonas_sp.AAC.1
MSTRPATASPARSSSAITGVDVFRESSRQPGFVKSAAGSRRCFSLDTPRPELRSDPACFCRGAPGRRFSCQRSRAMPLVGWKIAAHENVGVIIYRKRNWR